MHFVYRLNGTWKRLCQDTLERDTRKVIDVKCADCRNRLNKIDWDNLVRLSEAAYRADLNMSTFKDINSL